MCRYSSGDKVGVYTCCSDLDPGSSRQLRRIYVLYVCVVAAVAGHSSVSSLTVCLLCVYVCVSYFFIFALRSASIAISSHPLVMQVINSHLSVSIWLTALSYKYTSRQPTNQTPRSADELDGVRKKKKVCECIPTPGHELACDKHQNVFNQKSLESSHFLNQPITP